MHKIKKDYKIQIKKKHYISKFEFPLAYTHLNPLEIPRLAPKVLTQRLIIGVCIGFTTEYVSIPSSKAFNPSITSVLLIIQDSI